MWRRYFDLGLGGVLLVGAAACIRAGEPKPELPVRVEHKLLADLGGEHIAQAICRRGRGGEMALVGWGDRILEWARMGGAHREVFPAVEGFAYSNGGCALDVDGDGADEVVIARGAGRWCNRPKLYWFREGSSGVWTEHLAAETGLGASSPHNILPLSFAGPRPARGVVVLADRRSIEWYEIPADPKAPWIRHPIATLPKANQSGLKIGDIAGRGRPDLVCGTYWAECPADPLQEPWAVHRYGQWEGEFGGMDQLALADLDGDGRLEIVAAEAEIPDSRLAVFTRDPRAPDGAWKCSEIDRGLYCPHSLVVADLDGDGRPDIVAGEMSAGGWKFPLHDNPRIYAYFNRGGGRFEKRVLWEGEGVHEMGMLPRREGGPVVLFAADETQTWKIPDMKTHVNLWTISLQGSIGRRN
ncbi:MAG: VCBS repeat-containing protein [Verrucomicrobia bacterium]|nr:VCBS repeat-containing protein [Verrucomicrobiota bacterium]HOX03963.1 VCBS repeat-containing protein [Verrucomicrobiota bacterium]